MEKLNELETITKRLLAISDEKKAIYRWVSAQNKDREMEDKIWAENQKAYTDWWEANTRYVSAMEEYKKSLYRPLEDGETIGFADQFRWSANHNWEPFKASVGQIWVASEWAEGTETRTFISSRREVSK